MATAQSISIWGRVWERAHVPRVAPVMSTFWPASEKRASADTAGVGSMAVPGDVGCAGDEFPSIPTAAAECWPWRSGGAA